MGGTTQQRPDLITEQYRARRLGGLFTQDPTILGLIQHIVGQARPGVPNLPGQLFPGAPGETPIIDVGVLPPELTVPTPPGGTPETGTLPPNMPNTGSGQPTPPPAPSPYPPSLPTPPSQGSNLPVDPSVMEGASGEGGAKSGNVESNPTAPNPNQPA